MGILFLIALILAWPTMGFSIIAYIVFVILRSYLVAKSRIHYSNERSAERTMSRGEQKVPSWAGDRSENEIFVTVIQQGAMRKGVPQAFLHAVLGDSGTFKSLVHYAGAMEHEGASFTEQQVAVADKLVEIWKEAPSEVRETLMGQ